MKPDAVWMLIQTPKPRMKPYETRASLSRHCIMSKSARLIFNVQCPINIINICRKLFDDAKKLNHLNV